MIKVYHNPRCKKSREGLAYLQEKGVEHTVLQYIKEGITQEELKNILMKMGVEPEAILRKQEKLYKEQYKGMNFTTDEWIKIMTTNPNLIARPLVVSNTKAVLGDPPQNIDMLGI